MDPRQLRAGDAERAATTDRLASAHALGQIDVDEFHERVEQAHSARTRGDLEALVFDLPEPDRPRSGRAARYAEAVTPFLASAASMVARVPRQVWFALVALMFAGMVFGDDDHDGWEHHEAGAHEHGFFPGVMHFVVAMLVATALFFVVRRVRATKAASRAGL